MPEKKIGNTYYDEIINIGTTNTILIRDMDMNIIFDPGILQLCRYGAMNKRLSEFNLKPDDIDIVVNSHCHYDHIESNHLFMEKPLIIHEKELQYCDRLYWPEFRGAFIDIMDVQPIKGSMNITDNIEIIETSGHTPGSITLLVNTEEGEVACVGDAVIVKEDLLMLRPPSVQTKNISVEMAIESLKKIRDLNLHLVIPGHDAPFSPQIPP
jgi:glyoxylase-like metal-dependent hydrolase (beta-lactamase superfamily II)